VPLLVGASALPSNTWFSGPTRLSIPNCISIDSAVFGHLTPEKHYILQWAATSPIKIAPSQGNRVCRRKNFNKSSDGRPFGHNRHGPKRGGCCIPFRGRTRSPSNTMLPGRRPASVPSGILIHPIVSPQYINVTDSTDRQYNCPVA